MSKYGLFEKELLVEIEKREDELRVLKTFPLGKSLSEKQQAIAIKYAIPNIYSIWEGGVKTIFRIYVDKINSEGLHGNEMHPNLLIHAADMKYPQITTGVANEFEKKKKFVSEFLIFTSSPIVIEHKLPTESNIKFKVINQILERLNLVPFPIKPYEKYLNDLLLFRNSIAHGESSIPIQQFMIDDCANHVVELMNELMFKVLEGYKNSTFKK
jgi:MAE_28990/MAE_18760-like HEPN